MPAVLEQPLAERLCAFAGGRVLLAFDFDGTLAPIVAHPEAAALRDETRALLSQLVRRYPVAIITGRALDDVTRRLDGVPIAAIIGNHGIEPSSHMETSAAAVAAWLPVLTSALDGLPGVVVENKRHSISVHYRHAPSPERAHEAIRSALGTLPADARVMEGLRVVNVVHAAAPTKGDALLDLRLSLGTDATLYVGDDITDEDAFAAQDPERCIGVRIGTAESRARFHLRSQSEVDVLLAALIACRPDGTS